RLFDLLPDDIEWVVVADPRHVHYLANFLVHPLSFSGGERGLLILEREGSATLVADNFARRSAAGEPFVDDEVIHDWYDHRHSVINRDHALLAALKRVADRLYGRPGTLEAEWLPVGAWEVLGLDRETHSVRREPGEVAPGQSPADPGSLLRQLRRRKEPDEIELLRVCMRAGEAGHARAREIVRPGVGELEIYCEVQSAAITAAGRPVLVYGDFRATSAGRPKAGGLPTGCMLQDGDLFLLDYSVVIDGYRSDFTNTIAAGTPSDAQRRLLETCRAAIDAGEQHLRTGVAARAVYSAVSGALEQAGYGPLGHHAGHGIGLAHPEPPILVPDSDDVLQSGDVVTLEPGLYVEGVGGLRIERNYLITDAGCERLSHHELTLD
ncbi:MAG: Xaa-Pro peptidase family protein, partial [Planctomycetes bacterium]|nr:Xaa-Pro peptidase family protein [Planctomycetota bacterium]